MRFKLTKSQGPGENKVASHIVIVGNIYKLQGALALEEIRSGPYYTINYDFTFFILPFSLLILISLSRFPSRSISNSNFYFCILFNTLSLE
jgi:hypothetical protein